MYEPQFTEEEIRAGLEMLEEAFKDGVPYGTSEAQGAVVDEILASCISSEGTEVGPVLDLFPKASLRIDSGQADDVPASKALNSRCFAGDSDASAS